VAAAVFSVFAFFGCSREELPAEEAPFYVNVQTIENFTITQMHRGKIVMILSGEFAVINSENVADIYRPVMKFYSGGRHASTLTAERAKVNLERYDFKCSGKCVILSEKKEKLATTDLEYDAGKRLVYSRNNFTITGPGRTICGTSFESDLDLNNIVIKNQRVILD